MLFPFTENYLPIQQPGDSVLLESLVDLDRVFIKNLSVTGNLDIQDPAVYLLDTGQEPYPLYYGETPTQDSDFWYWAPKNGPGTWPQLPIKQDC